MPYALLSCPLHKRTSFREVCLTKLLPVVPTPSPRTGRFKIRLLGVPGNNLSESSRRDPCFPEVRATGDIVGRFGRKMSEVNIEEMLASKHEARKNAAGSFHGASADSTPSHSSSPSQTDTRASSDSTTEIPTSSTGSDSQRVSAALQTLMTAKVSITLPSCW